MEIIFSIIRYLGLLFLSGYAATFTPNSFVDWYKTKFPEPGGFGLDLSSVPAYFVVTLGIFAFLTVLFGRNIFRFKQVYIILGIALVLGMLMDSIHFYVYPVAVLSGGILGLTVRFVTANTLGKMPAFESWKKYF